jgi:dienelactone hydrolase
MSLQSFLLLFKFIPLLILLEACTNHSASRESKSTEMLVKINEQIVTYSVDSTAMKGFLAFDENQTQKRPAILIVPEWWGLNDYTKNRARQLTMLGYVAFVADMYGNGIIAANPTIAEKLSTPFYYNPQMAKNHFDAALAKLKTYPQVDTTRIAAIGYCFGGALVINMANLGTDLKGVVCFHGNVMAGVPIDKNLLKSKILVCNGAIDEFVPPDEIALFKKQMDSIGANYAFKNYANATHAFTNPEATMIGKRFNLAIAYNRAADSASWNDMRKFLTTIFN